MPGFRRNEPEAAPLPEPEALVRTPFDDMHDHRLRLYVEMGFSEASAAVLADVRDGVFPLWPGKVQKALKAGCTHEQALAVFG